MAAFPAFIFTLLFGIIKAQGTGWAEGSFSGPGVDIQVQVASGKVTMDICGPTDRWFGVGFAAASTTPLTMDGTYAIIVYSTATDGTTTSTTAQEYTLATRDKGTTAPTAMTFKQAYQGNDGKVCAQITRDAISSVAAYNFPNTFSNIPETTRIIVAKGGVGSLDYTASDAKMDSSKISTTLSYIEGIAPSPAPTVSPVGQVIATESASSKSVCFSSDSWVLTYPDFERKQIEDLNVYDVILTYDEVNDIYFWDELLVKLHFEEGEYLNDIEVEMREFILNNGERLYITDSHLLYVGHSGLHRADQVKLGDKLKIYDGSYVDVIGINENIIKYPRNLITYNGNLVINGVAISTFTDTIWGESKYWSKSLRTIMKYGYSFNIWRYTAYYAAKAWNEYASLAFKDAVLRFYCNPQPTEQDDDDEKSHWFSSFFSS